MINKIKTYIGFAIKSNKILLGTDNILASNKPKLVLISDELSENAEKKLSKNNKCFKLKKQEFETAVTINGVKAIAVVDVSLAETIKKLLEVQ